MKHLMNIFSVLVLILFLCISSSACSRKTNKSLHLIIENFEIVVPADHDEMRFEGIVRNNSNKKLNNIKVYVEVFNDSTYMGKTQNY